MSDTPRVRFSCGFHAVEQAKGDAPCPYCELAEARRELTELKKPGYVLVPVEWLEEARDEVEAWGAYAGEYFKEKWNLRADIDKWKERIRAAKEES